MSRVLRSLLNAWAHESEQLLEDARAIAEASIPPNYAAVDVLAVPSTVLGLVDATNGVGDPQGLGDQTAWSAAGAALTASDEEIPGHWTRAMVATPAGGAVAHLQVLALPLAAEDPPARLRAPVTLPAATIPLDTTAGLANSGSAYVGGQLVTYTGKDSDDLTGAAGGTGDWPTGTPVTRDLERCWWYALVRADQAFRVSVAHELEPDARFATIELGPQSGWVIVGGPVDLQAGATYRLVMETPGNATAGQRLWMTGATIAQGNDPLGPFAGDAPVEGNYAYSWRGAINGSQTERHTRNLDLLAMREAEAGLDVAPVGATEEQRREYLLARRGARFDSSARALVDLVVKLIQTDSPGFTAESVRVRRNYRNRSFTVAIAYSPNGVLANRVYRLIKLLKPSAIALEGDEAGIHWGWTYGQAQAAYATYGDAQAAFPTYDAAQFPPT